MHVPMTEINLHDITRYQKQRLYFHLTANVVAEELFSINMNIVIVMFHFRSADLFFHVRSADSHMRTWRKRVSEVLQ